MTLILPAIAQNSFPPTGAVLVNGANNNSGKADFAVGVGSGGVATIALSGNQFRVGSTDVNWSMWMSANGAIQTFNQDLTLYASGGASASQSIKFFARHNGTTGERFRITSRGDIGIGTTTPNNTQGWGKVLDLHGSNHAKLLVTTGGSDVRTGVFSHDSWYGSAGRIGTESNHDLRFMAGYGGDQMVLKTNGKVGIGTLQPVGHLDIVGDTYHKGRIFLTDPLAGDPATGTEYAYLWLDNVSKDLKLNMYNGNWNTSITFQKGGNVGIGTTTPGEKLEVNGTIRSKRVKVEATGWPDYVFESNYRLMTIGDLEQYVQNNKHLPEVPSAKQIEKEGLDLGDMDATLLKKIEELTLYTIDQENRIKKQDELISRLLMRLEKLEKEK